MGNIYTYKEFLLTETSSGERVALFPGRFMPVHNGHIEAFARTSYEFDHIRVIPIQIAKAGPDSPFPKELLDRIGKAVYTEKNNLLADWIMFPDEIKTVIPQMAKLVMAGGFDPVALGCGADRYSDYKRQVDYLLSPKSDVKVNEFAIESVMSRDADGPSGAKVRLALKTGSEKDFQKLVPKSIWSFYGELKTYI